MSSYSNETLDDAFTGLSAFNASEARSEAAGYDVRPICPIKDDETTETDVLPQRFHDVLFADLADHSTYTSTNAYWMPSKFPT